MKGVILAGGTGSRLHPLTRITNKHLLPLHDRPMVTYAIEALVNAGIEEMMLVTGGTHAARRGELCRAGARCADPALAGREHRPPAPSRRARAERERARGPDRREAGPSAEQVRGHRDLLLRRVGLGRDPHLEVVGPL